MICIYAIVNTTDGKRYVGQTSNFEKRKKQQIQNMKSFNPKSSNRHLCEACEKHGIESFKFEILETFETLDRGLLLNREFEWINKFSCDQREYGYNIRKDLEGKCITSDETRQIMSDKNKGENNPNYGKKWSYENKSKMSDLAKKRHSETETYNEAWKEKLSEASKEMWKDEKIRKSISEKLSVKKQKYDFLQYTKDGVLVAKWSSVKEIIKDNPSYKWQNIYSVCNGYKKSYKGYVWKSVLKDIGDA